MTSVAALAETAALIGDPARCAMLAALMQGRALTAGELARSAGVSPQTASGHLARLGAAGLLAVERQGRHRYHRLASPAVARLLEGLMEVAGAAPRRVATGPRDGAMRVARTCYDHLAGRLGVALADALAAQGAIELTADGGAVTERGEAVLRGLGVHATPRKGRLFCRPCLDWSERRPHVGGVLGAALCARCFELGWVRRREGGRTLEITPAGWLGLRERLGIAPEAVRLP
jgi:DNA-binding transcriptional ArsR family regulator